MTYELSGSVASITMDDGKVNSLSPAMLAALREAFVVVACTGHALAMAAVVMLNADLRIGIEGPYKMGLHEVAIGMTVLHFGIEIARQRLAPAHFNLALTTAFIYSPQEAVTAGFLDRRRRFQGRDPRGGGRANPRRHGGTRSDQTASPRGRAEGVALRDSGRHRRRRRVIRHVRRGGDPDIRGPISLGGGGIVSLRGK